MRQQDVKYQMRNNVLEGDDLRRRQAVQHINNYIINRKHASQSYVNQNENSCRQTLKTNEQNDTTFKFGCRSAMDVEEPRPKVLIKQLEFKNSAQKNNIEKLQQKLNEIMDWKKIYDERPNHSSSDQVMPQNVQKSFMHVLSQHANEFRSITPDRPLNGNQKKGAFANAFASAFGIPPHIDERAITTEPNDNKKVIKSFSQENNINDILNRDHRGTQLIFTNRQNAIPNSLEYLIILQKLQQERIKRKQFSIKKSLKHSSTEQEYFEQILYVIQDSQQLNQIGQQINAILSQNRLIKKPTHPNRPQSEVLSILDTIKNTDTSANQIHHNKKVDQDIQKRGTETERGYQNRQSQARSQISQGTKQTNGDAKAGNRENSHHILKHAHRSVNEEFQDQDKKTGFSSQQTSQSKQLYLQYIQNKRPSEKSPVQPEINGQQNSCLELWSSEKQDSNPQRIPSYYTQNQQSHSQSSIRRQEERPTQDHDNSKSENTTSRIIGNTRIIVSNYVNDRTPTKNLFGNLKNFQSPRVSGQKINSILSSVNKQIYTEKLGNPATHIRDDLNQTHIMVSYADFSLCSYNLQNKKSNYVGRHSRAITYLSRIQDINHAKVFASGSRDGVIKIWASEPTVCNYRLTHQFRVTAPPLFLMLMNSMMFVITAAHVVPVLDFQRKGAAIPFCGTLKDVKMNLYNELVLAINNKIYKLRRNELVLQYEHKETEIREMFYDEQKLYVLCDNGSIITFEEGVKLKRINLQIKQVDSMFGQAQEQVNHFNKYFTFNEKRKR